MKKEWTGLGAYIGEIGCYRPDDNVICLGIEMLSFIWLNDTIDKLIEILKETLIHEGTHKAIYEVTGSKRACLYFDLIFYPPFDRKANLEWFRHG